MRRAAEMESWADDNFAALEKLQSADHATQTWPARAPNCDGATALVLPDGPAGLRNMLDKMALPRIKAAVALGAAEPAVAASIGDDGQWEPDAFRAIDMDTFREEVAAWKRTKDETPPDAPQPPH